MLIKKIAFTRQLCTFYFDATFAHLKNIVAQKTTVLITDEHIFAAHKKSSRDGILLFLTVAKNIKCRQPPTLLYNN